ncbi:omega-6 fatty acid desaturase, endoplasmic reticulum isozyme [Musa troglodytarum]|uniref:Omega-6 fatty acid desaturase, endoplasmic reticulum isozyme n=1 Tax=Musa troglodytarum TaxID=320322 RepID=A0A9E7I3Z8_9LILI|nr:omega-6 fatty acid desaturase, endoplasmic reticulum isozyme [Musa troglodytarum]
MTATEVPLRCSPTEKLPFTLGQIKKAIPPHCFDRSVIRSFSYAVRDLLFAALFLYVAVTHIPKLSLGLGLALAAAAHRVLQWMRSHRLWVIAHECGHHTFSDYSSSMTSSASPFIPPPCPLLLLEVQPPPHHSNTGTIERDEVFVPKLKATLSWYSKYLNNPHGRIVTPATSPSVANVPRLQHLRPPLPPLRLSLRPLRGDILRP